MKRFFYGLMLTSLVFVQGCQKDAEVAPKEDETVESVSIDDMDEVESAEAEARAIKDLARLLAEEAGSELEMAAFDADSFDKALQEIEEQDPELLAWGEPTFNPIQFDLNSKEINETQNDVLALNIDRAREAVEAGHRLLVQGHVDPMCEAGLQENLSLALAEDRANSVRNKLVEAGIPASSIEVAAVGGTDPLTWSTASSLETQLAELAPNRRVELYVQS